MKAPDTFLETGVQGDQVMLRAAVPRAWWLRWLPRRDVVVFMPPATARRLAASLNHCAATALHRKGG